jgi:hypothetical protein
MPDKHGFDHLVDWGRVTHRCIEEGCEYPEGMVSVSERDRARHHAQHQRTRRSDAERRQREALAKARRLKAQAERENARVYGEGR